MSLPILHVTIIGKDTVLATDNTGDEVAFAVSIGHALLVDNSLRLCREVWPHVVKQTLYFTYLIECYGGTGIAFDTADALALRQVATEALCQDVG
jgi:hypothetical protein